VQGSLHQSPQEFSILRFAQDKFQIYDFRFVPDRKIGKNAPKKAMKATAITNRRASRADKRSHTETAMAPTIARSHNMNAPSKRATRCISPLFGNGRASRQG